MLSPAEQSAQMSDNHRSADLADFRRLYSFPLDHFQVEACRAVEAGNGVLVAAPTGSGKTIVGEFAVHLALVTGRKCFYTTPIKALSNQKFNDLVNRYGTDRVGLLTGDNTINGEAPIVVMTTEVLRNMLYSGSRTLTGLGFVVMDEVHYLANRFRGAVWEEVIIHLPESVSIVSLSATVSNAEEFGAWLTEVRGNNVTIVEERRPVPLYQHVMVGKRMYPLFAPDGERVNESLARLARDDWQLSRTANSRPAKGSRRPRSRYFPPRRVEMVDKLDGEGLLPAIVFIFSRAGCAAAVQECLDSNLSLTTPAERTEIRAFVDSECSSIPRDDLEVLGYYEFLDGLSRGIAAHHAGQLPTFKEVIENLFSRGLCKVVFATETLALGINMPARSVVIEKLSKWNGETHAEITPGEYTQLTGRAGRRGIDVEGHGVVLWQPGLNPKEVAGLASTRTYPLNSSFEPSYNMAVNLVNQVGRETARALLEQSFAQFQADRSVVGLARQIHKSEEALEGYRTAAHCDVGNFMEYAGLRRKLSDLESQGVKRRKNVQREDVMESLTKLRPGDVIRVPAGRFSGVAVVLDPGTQSDRDGPRPLVLTVSRQARRLALVDFPTPVQAITRMRIPRSFNPRNPQMRRDLASALRDKTHGVDGPRPKSHPNGAPTEDLEISRLRADLRAHPCHSCADRESHARWAERYLKLDRDTQNLRQRIERRTNTVARQFDRVCEVLDGLGYLDGDHVTPDGKRLQRLYSELDLLASECIRTGAWAGLDANELASVLSGLTFETRNSDDVPPPRFPRGRIREVAEHMTLMSAELEQLEHEHRLHYLRKPDFGFAQSAWEWTSGMSLDDVLTSSGLAAGDFVRGIKQLIDVTAQVADAAGHGPLRATAHETLDLLRHGVVAYSSINE